jgi:hypothetical protein
LKSESVRMDLLCQAVRDTAYLLWKVLPTMFAGLFGVEVLVRLGLMRKIEAVGAPLARISRLPPQTLPAFVTSIGSLAAANTMLAGYHADKLITDRELVLGSVFNTVPLHFKETITYQLPVILPLLGMRLCLIYIVTFWLSGFLKLGFVIYQGRKLPPQPMPDRNAADPAGTVAGSKTATLIGVLRQAFHARKGLFGRMALLLVIVTFIVQLLLHAGVLSTLELLIAPAAGVFGLPAAVVAPVSVYIVSPIVGITTMSSLLQQHLVSEYQAIVALLAGGFIMVPVMRLRGTLPRYISILGWKHGSRVMYITTVLSLAARAMVLAGVMMFCS